MKPVIMLLGGICLLLTSCNQPRKKLTAIVDDAPQVSVERGKYLVTTSGCIDCHAPKKWTENGPEPDMSRFLSGHPQGEELPPLKPGEAKGYILFNMGLTAAKGPWGTSFAANLTPHETGIGNWTEEQFLRAVKQGQWRGLEGTRKLMPPMPWPMFAHMTDADVKSIFAYLKTLDPVDNVVPNYSPPGP